MIKLSNIIESILIEGRVDDFKSKYISIPDSFKNTGYENIANNLRSLMKISELKSYFNLKYNKLIR